MCVVVLGHAVFDGFAEHFTSHEVSCVASVEECTRHYFKDFGDLISIKRSSIRICARLDVV